MKVKDDTIIYNLDELDKESDRLYSLLIHSRISKRMAGKSREASNEGKDLVSHNIEKSSENSELVKRKKKSKSKNSKKPKKLTIANSDEGKAEDSVSKAKHGKSKHGKDSSTTVESPGRVADVVDGVDYIDRDLSWVQFNHRVIEQTKRIDIPYHERIKFIGIAASNLDEFISVRFSKHLAQENADEHYIARLRKDIEAQKQEIAAVAKEFVYDVPAISEKVIRPDEEYRKAVKSTFRRDIYAALSPIGVDQNKEVPLFKDGELNLFIKVRDNNKESNGSGYCFIQIPHQLGRIFKVKGGYMFIEDIILANLDSLFSNKKIVGSVLFTVSKEYSEKVDKDTFTPIINRVNKVLVNRNANNITSIDVVEHSDTKSSLIKHLVKLLKVPKKHVFKFTDSKYLAMQYFVSKPFKKIDYEPNKISGKCWNKSFEAKTPSELIGEKYILDYLDDEDLIVHHPYETYDVVTGFIQEASMNKDVISIKQTLYRVSSEKSPIIEALCNAAKNGIKVTVMLELLARGDESQNIRLISKLKEAGCNVVYSLEGLKTHAKMCIVTKYTKKHGITIYSHVATGNYNEKTARIYTDISYFTSKSRIGLDLTKIFNMISGFSEPSELKVLSYSPTTLRQTLYEEMDKCVEYCNASADQESLTRSTPSDASDSADTASASVGSKPLTRIGIKINALSDLAMVKKLEEVSEAAGGNIQIDIICRGVCSLVPRRENIRVKSIVGRFLEHSRIYTFTRGKKTKVYISSADLLTRNLDRRIETLIPITDSKCKKKILDIFYAHLDDTANSWDMDENGNYKRIDTKYGNLEGIKYQNTQNDYTKI